MADQHRLRPVVSAELLAGDPPADRGFPPLHPRGPRHSPIAAILLTNGDLDHCLGLLSLRESHPLVIYATDRAAPRVHRRQRAVPDSRSVSRPGHVAGAQARAARRNWPTSRASLRAFWSRPWRCLASCRIHLEADGTSDPEDSVGFRIRERASGRILAYSLRGRRGDRRGSARRRGRRLRVLRRNLLVERRASRARARDEARRDRWPTCRSAGPDGSLARLHGLAAPRRIFIHVNNTNPLLRDDSPERAQPSRRAGWEVARDGMEVRI